MTDTTSLVLDGIQPNPENQKAAADERLENYQRAMNRILRGPIDAEIDPQDWHRIKQVQSLLQVRLEEMGMSLTVVDSDQVCYLSNLVQMDGAEEGFSPFRPSTLSRQTSILLLLVLQKYLQSEGEIDKNLRMFTVDEMANALLVYEDTTATDITSQMQKKTKQKLKELEDMRLIRSNETTRLKTEELIYEARPLVKYFADQQRINNLKDVLEQYQRSGSRKTIANDETDGSNDQSSDEQNTLGF